MIAVIVAGGSGSRLWPLSTPDYPKHLLKVNGRATSLLQDTYARATRLSDKVFVLTEQGHANHVKEQLTELDDAHFIIEPARRGTANCIVAALVYLKKHGVPTDEPIAFIAADHYIRDWFGFSHSFRVAGEASRDASKIVLVGVEPDYPATGFGYIKKGKVYDEQRLVFNVDCFREKPDHKTAQQYQRSGDYLWNCGYFIGAIDTFEKTMKEDAPDLLETYQKLTEAAQADAEADYAAKYLMLKNDTIDYALLEKTSELLVVPASFDWMDLGSFYDLHKAADTDELGNHTDGGKVELEEVENSLVQNYEDKPLAVIGLDNVVVVNTPQGIIVARKDLSQKVGAVSKRFNDKQ